MSGVDVRSENVGLDGAAVVDAPRAPAVDVRRLRRRRQIIAAVFLAPVVAIAGSVGFRAVQDHYADPRLFDGLVAVDMYFTRDYEPGAVYTVPLSYGQDLPDVVLHRVEPQLAPGSAWVSLQTSLCEPSGPHGIEGVGGPLEQCAGLVRVDGVEEIQAGDGVDLGTLPGYELALSLVPLAPGRIEVTGVEIEYDHDGRRITETYPVRFWMDPEGDPSRPN